MKKCALSLALVLSLSTLTWGSIGTGIDVMQSNSIATNAFGITMCSQMGVHSWVVSHVMQMSVIPTGCHNTCVPNGPIVFHWPCPHSGGCDCHHNGINGAVTSATSSSNTIAHGPVGNATADSSSSSSSWFSSSTSSSHSQSIAN
jgi:hypothetical protein